MSIFIFSFNWRIRIGIARDAQLAALSAAGSGNGEQAAHAIALPDRAVSSKLLNHYEFSAGFKFRQVC